MAKEVWFELPPFRDDYQLAEVETDLVQSSVRSKQFLLINQSECILCEGCVDICPWKCIHMLSPDSVAEAVNVVHPADDPDAGVIFVVDEDECTRCALCVDRCPTGVIVLGKFGPAARGSEEALGEEELAPWEVDTGERDHTHGYIYGKL